LALVVNSSLVHDTLSSKQDLIYATGHFSIASGPTKATLHPVKSRDVSECESESGCCRNPTIYGKSEI